MATETIRIGSRWIGGDHPVYVVAELSANHNQSFEKAVALVEAAKAAGADAVKLQTYTAQTLTLDSRRPEFLIDGTLWSGRRLHDLYSEAYTPWEWHPRLQEVAYRFGLDFFSSVFDPTSVDFLEGLSVPAYKIASFELVDLPLLAKAARTGKPLILSTGMATFAEIEEAIQTVRNAGATQIALLKCVSAYPAPEAEMNLRTIPHLATTFGMPVGLSDHTLGSTAAVAAVALGARLLEKHLTLSRSEPGPDSAFSLEPQEFRETVAAVRAVQRALGDIAFGGTPSEEKSKAFRRSLFVVEDVAAGEVFTERNVRSIRPAQGLHTRHLSEILGRRARQRIERGTPLSWDLVEGARERRG